MKRAPTFIEWRICCDFKKLFDGWWNEYKGEGWEGFKFMRNLQFVKSNQKVRNREKFGDIEETKTGVVKEINEINTLNGEVQFERIE